MWVLQLMLRYKGASTGIAFFLTLGSIYGAIAPNWNPIVEYCVPGSNCKVLLKVDSRVFEWNRQQTAANAKNHSIHNEWLIRANDIAAATGLTITQAENTLSPASTKEFIALTADARQHGWLVQGIQDYPGWGVVRKVMGALALASSLGSIWLLSQIEEELPEHETRLARTQSTATQKILAWYELNEGAYSLAQCEQMYADGTIAHIEGQLAILDELDSRNEQKLLSGSTTLDSITHPGDKVEAGEEVQAIAPTSEIFNPRNYPNPDQLPKSLLWLREFVSNSCLILGSQGSGKSWMVRLFVLLKKLKGYRVIVFDPNSNRASWMGVEFHGSYEDIAQKMQWYVDEIQSRYDAFRESSMSEEQWRSSLWKDGKAISIICEEFSTYSDFISDTELLKKFVKSAATLSRKQEAPVVFITHNLTKECCGNISGLFDIFKRMQRLTLDTTTDPKTDQPISAGTGTIKAVDSDEFRSVILPKLSTKVTDFRSEDTLIEETRLQLLRYEQMEGISTPQPVESSKTQLSDLAQKLYDFLKRTNRIEADIREFKSNFKVNGERFSIEILRGLTLEIVEAGLATKITEHLIRLVSGV